MTTPEGGNAHTLLKHTQPSPTCFPAQNNIDIPVSSVDCNEELLITDHDKILHAIDVLESKLTPRLTETYAHLASDAFKTLPVIQLEITGKSVPFVVDSGATRSVIEAAELSPKPKMSRNFIYSISASGQTVKEILTAPLTCLALCGTSFKHSLLWSKMCPINLLGRDLMCLLGINLMSTPGGVKVTFQQDSVLSAVHFSVQSPTYVYMWHPSDSTLTQQLTEEAKNDFVGAAD